MVKQLRKDKREQQVKKVQDPFGELNFLLTLQGKIENKNEEV